MKKFVIVALTLALVASLFLTSCSSVLDSTTIAGSWFCQLGEDDGLLENEYTFDIKTDGSYTFTYIYKVLGIQSTYSGRETGSWTFDGGSSTLTLKPASGSIYSFKIAMNTYPANQGTWSDLDQKLDIAGFDTYSNREFKFIKD